MRHDDVGFFWNDEPAKKVSKAAPKPVKIIPKKVWLEPDYLPNLAEAKAMPGMQFLKLEELSAMQKAKEELLFDIECYPNYFLASFRSFSTGKAIAFELGGIFPFNLDAARWVIENFTIVGFNSLKYDLPIMALALQGRSTEELKAASDRIIQEGATRKELLRSYKCKLPKCDMIDLMELVPLHPSLKTCAGRLHAPKCQDLPVEPSTILTEDQKAIVRWYNLNGDLTVTGFLYARLQSHIELRKAMSLEEGIDLRSKSDPQIAETVISSEWTKITGKRPEKAPVEIGAVHSYKAPAFIQYTTPMLQAVKSVVEGPQYIVNEKGRIGLPKAVKALKLEINGSIYRMGIGGLHSSEKSSQHKASEDLLYFDKDVTSYYPNTILNSGLFPPNLGSLFLRIFGGIVNKRVKAKKNGIVVKANGLKIVINGSFGKMGNQHSILYAPQLLIHVTLTGQLSLLMLIEKLELSGIHVISANTDGIIIECPARLKDLMDSIVSDWEKATGYGTEETRYTAIYSRDVNNYIAIEPDGEVKRKGAYYNAWLDKDPRKALEHNPSNSICSDAVVKFLAEGIPVEKTIRECKDIRGFITVRRVAGGAVKIWPNGAIEYLGKAIRWYYSNQIEGALIYAENGNRVPESEGARPAMQLPTGIPSDLDYDKYISESIEMLRDLGV